MSKYYTWDCEIAVHDIDFRLSRIGVDFMSGCLYEHDHLLIAIQSMSIDEEAQNNKRVLIVKHTNGKMEFKVLFNKASFYSEFLDTISLYNQTVAFPLEEKVPEAPDSPSNVYANYKFKVDISEPYDSFVVYKTFRNMYIVGSLSTQTNEEYHILKIELTSTQDSDECLQDLIVEDKGVYSLQSVQILLTNVHEGNKTTGGLVRVTSGKAILGFIRFTKSYYLVIATEVKPEGILMGHIVYSISSSSCICLCEEKKEEGLLKGFLSKRKDNNDQEEKCLGLFNMMDLSNGYYFCYSYPLSNSVQHNILATTHQLDPQQNSMFIWNTHLLSELKMCVSSSWFSYLIQGVFIQQHCSLNETLFQLSVIARRSRMYAGPRYLKRGINEEGYVANEVEIETIVEDGNGHITSHIQLRGSIPAYWKQDVSVAVPRPPIQIVKNDPLHRTFKLHMELLLQRYSAPIQVLDLVKRKEKHPRESLISELLYDSCRYVNKMIPSGMKITYWPLDFADIAKKSSSENPLLHDILLRYSRMSLDATGFFSSYVNEGVKRRLKLGADYCKEDGVSDSFRDSLLRDNHLEQRGIMRSNCIDCLDRTNVAQFFLSYTVLYRMLYTLGIEFTATTPDISPLQKLLVDMYKEVGDIISLQYGGSNAHDKIEVTKGNKKKREILTTLLRHYNNAFTDKIKQESYNVFLGVYQPRLHNPITRSEPESSCHQGLLSDGDLAILEEAKWWYGSLIRYEQSIGNESYYTGSIGICTVCKKPNEIRNSFICASCGALLRKQLPYLDCKAFYVCNTKTFNTYEFALENHKTNNYVDLNQLLKSECYEVHYLSSNPIEGETTPSSNLRPQFWKDWNARTQSTVQYVGYDSSDIAKHISKRKTKAGDDEEEEEEDEDDKRKNRFGTLFNSSSLSLQTVDDLNVSEEHTTGRNEGSPTGRISMGSRKANMSGKNNEVCNLRDYEFFKYGDKVSEYCVFPSHHSIRLTEKMLYDEYSNYDEKLIKEATLLHNTSPSNENHLYSEYMDGYKLEVEIDPANCATQQQQQNGTYIVKRENTEYDGSTSCCVLVDVDKNEKDAKERINEYLANKGIA